MHDEEGHLPGAWRVYVRSVAFVIGVLFALGAVGHALPESSSAMRVATPEFLLLASVLVLTPAVITGGWRFVLWAGGAFVFVHLVDAAGVVSPTVFGDFEFGPHLGWTWGGVPLLVTLNWILVMNGAICLAGRLVPPVAERLRKPTIMLLAGVIAVGFDWILEPAAIRLDYWHWTNSATPPAGNFLAIFAFALIFTAVHPRHLRNLCDLGTNGRLAGVYLLMQTVFLVFVRAAWWFQGV